MVLRCQWQSFQTYAPTLYQCIRPQTLVQGPWLAIQVSHCWHDLSTLLRNAASSTIIWPYQVFCWLQGVILKFLHAVLSVFPLPCSGKGLFVQPLFLCLLTTIRTHTCHTSLLGISIGTSSFCRWGFSQRCLPNQGIAQTSLPAGSEPRHCHPLGGVVPTTCGGSSDNRHCQTACPFLTFWWHVHFYWRSLLDTASAPMCLHLWQCSDVELYSWRCWTQQGVCLTWFLKLSSHVKVQWSLQWRTLVHSSV
jgi:hypothetical protein